MGSLIFVFALMYSAWADDDDDTGDDNSGPGGGHGGGQEEEEEEEEDDADFDGVDAPLDCDDGDPLVFPGAGERCNGEDDDCDGIVPADELDRDLDGYAICNGDCGDGDAGISPEATEVCDDVDNDCDFTIDEGCPPGATGGSPTDTGSPPPGATPVQQSPGGRSATLEGAEDHVSGCGCDTSGALASVGWIAFAAVVGRRRRR